jgi:WhiB family transcriptional regulator, redox-sensing transcriptional regulator
MGLGLTVGHMRRERPWQRDGACSGRADHADWWFPQNGQSADPARAACARCAVRVECLAYAIDANIIDGVWGGLTPSERRKLLHGGEQLSPAHHAAASVASPPARDALEFPSGLNPLSVAISGEAKAPWPSDP